MSKSLNILGVTGSIGQSACNVVLSDPSRFDINLITAHENVDLLAQSAIKIKAKTAVIANPAKLERLQQLLQGTGIGAGTNIMHALSEKKVDVTLAAIVGMACLRPVLCAVEHCATLALASKEPVVVAGALLIATAQTYNTQIIPVDSEHNAIFQVSNAENAKHIERIILTASGGPFRTWTADQMARATPAQALAHPNWSMGEKISIDSATMMNKALEIIEAHYLFSMRPEKINVVIHPQSIVHSFVEYEDGSILAQLGASDMRTPIAYALAWPERMKTPGRTLDLKNLTLNFDDVDHEKFPAIRMAYDAIGKGPAFCITLNAANEVAVDAFLNSQIGFVDIIQTIAYGLENISVATPTTLEQIEQTDQEARVLAKKFIDTRSTLKTAAV